MVVAQRNFGRERNNKVLGQRSKRGLLLSVECLVLNGQAWWLDVTAALNDVMKEMNTVI